MLFFSSSQGKYLVIAAWPQAAQQRSLRIDADLLPNVISLSSVKRPTKLRLTNILRAE